MNLDENGFITTAKRVQLKPYIPRPFKNYQLMTHDELIAGAGGYLVFDSECYKNYFLIAFKNVLTGKIFYLETPFDPRLLSWIMHSYTTIGFNSIKYDLPLLWLSYQIQNLEKLKEASNDLINGLYFREFAAKYQSKVFPTPHIDLIEVCPLRGSLKLYGARLHAPRIQEMPLNPYDNLTEEEKLFVRDYCINDLDLTELALVNLKEQLALRELLSMEYKQNVMSKSDAQIAETVISSELQKISGQWPKKPKINDQLYFNFQVPKNMFFQTPYMQGILEKVAKTKFSLDENGRLERDNDIKNLRINIGNSIYRMGIGGLHSSEEHTSYKSGNGYQIYDRDVASFYPYILLNCKLYPSHLGEDFLKVYQAIVDRRLAAKKAKNLAVSENLKVTINGTFGKTGSPYSVIYAPEMTIQITVGGQLYLLMMIEALELEGIKVISANTDGVMMYIHKDQVRKYEDIIAIWESLTGFVTEETKYEAVYSRDVNAYIAVKNKEEVKGKNILYDPWNGKTAKDAYWRFQKNPNLQICVEAIEKLITKDIPIEKTIRDCKDITRFIAVRNVKGGAHKDREYLGQVIRWYHSTDVVGTINYITSGNKVPDTEGAMPVMDLPTEFPRDIDYQYYVDRTIGLLYEISYLSKPQLQLF